ncbi:hypothetical protein [Algoriphagus confluentis]|uniref:CPBP family intramembrane metalloprotease n=1 Tax=Algoriphagus confluentis TaxID=1697556 RepID=A0ABQ6PIF6_9BACT|nr:hypothetical protein Aconfl_03150 [Algoriphagus confluentis]
MQYNLDIFFASYEKKVKMDKKTRLQSLYIFLIFVTITALGALIGHFWVHPYPHLRVWNAENIFWILLGLPFVFFQGKVNIPEFLAPHVSLRTRICKPLSLGLIFGVLDVFIIKMVLHPEPYSELPPFLQPFPYSLLLYFSGALEIEIFYRLIPITLTLLIVSQINHGKYLNQAFWVIALLSSLREPLEQLPGGETWFIGYSLLSGFGMNFIQALYFRQAGFLATLMLRLGHYLVWHILLGVYVQWIELGGQHYP